MESGSMLIIVRTMQTSNKEKFKVTDLAKTHFPCPLLVGNFVLMETL